MKTRNSEVGVLNGKCPICGEKLRADRGSMRSLRSKSTQFGGDGLWYHEDCWMRGRVWSSKEHDFVLEKTKDERRASKTKG